MHAPVPTGHSSFALRRPLLALALVLLIGIVVRAATIGAAPLWEDEALTLPIVRWSAMDLWLQPVDPTGPLFYLLAKWLVPADGGVVAWRMISLVCGVVSIPLAYLAGRLVAGRGGAWFAAALLALSAPLIDYSQEARAYSLLVMLVLASAVGLLAWQRSIQRPRPSVWPALLFGVATVLAYSTHLAGIFWILSAVPLFVAASLKGNPRARAIAFSIAAAMAIAAMPETLRLFRRVAIGGGFAWLDQADLSTVLGTLARLWLPAGLWHNRWWDVPQSADGAILLACSGLLSWRLWLHRCALAQWRKSHPGVLAIIGMLLAAPCLMWLAGFLLVPIFMPRVALLSVPGFILLLTLWIELERRGWLPWIVVAAYALALALGGTTRQKGEWDQVAQALEAGAKPGDAILVCADWTYPALRHASRGVVPVPVGVARDGRVAMLEPALGASGPGWQDGYFRTSMADAILSRLGRPLLWRGRPVSIRAQRVWLVDSHCEAAERSVLANWVGRARWSTVGRFANPVAPTGIRLLLAERSSDAALAMAAER